MHIFQGQKDESRKEKVDRKHQVVSAQIIHIFSSLPGGNFIKEAINRLVSATSFAIGKNVGSDRLTDIKLLFLLSKANMAIGEVFDKMPVDILSMAKNGLEFATSIESVVQSLRYCISTRRKTMWFEIFYFCFIRFC